MLATSYVRWRHKVDFVKESRKQTVIMGLTMEDLWKAISTYETTSCSCWSACYSIRRVTAALDTVICVSCFKCLIRTFETIPCCISDCEMQPLYNWVHHGNLIGSANIEAVSTITCWKSPDTLLNSALQQLVCETSRFGYNLHYVRTYLVSRLATYVLVVWATYHKWIALVIL